MGEQDKAEDDDFHEYEHTIDFQFDDPDNYLVCDGTAAGKVYGGTASISSDTALQIATEAIRMKVVNNMSGYQSDDARADAKERMEGINRVCRELIHNEARRFYNEYKGRLEREAKANNE